MKLDDTLGGCHKFPVYDLKFFLHGKPKSLIANLPIIKILKKIKFDS